MDGHGSHLTLEVIEYCLANDIHLMCFPAHLTHMIQPLDVGIFGPIQRAYDKQAREWIKNPANGRMSLASFFLLYHQARETVRNNMVASSFRGTGLVPISEDQVLAKLPTLSSTSEPLPFNIAKPIVPFQPPSTPRNDRTIGALAAAARNPINASTPQLRTLVNVAVKGAQAAIADRDMLREELRQLRFANSRKPDEAEDVRSRRYGEEITAEDVVLLRRTALEEKRREEAAKEERKMERERRAEERRQEEKAKEERRIERERKAEERRLEELERKSKARERQLVAEENKRLKEKEKEEREHQKLEQRLANEAQSLVTKQLRHETSKHQLQPKERQKLTLSSKSATQDPLVVTSISKAQARSISSASIRTSHPKRQTLALREGVDGGSTVKIPSNQCSNEEIPQEVESGGVSGCTRPIGSTRRARTRGTLVKVPEKEPEEKIVVPTRSTRSGRTVKPQYWKTID